MTDNDPYARGVTIDVMPIPPVPENCLEIPAGPVKFVLEFRKVDPSVIQQHRTRVGEFADFPFDNDSGASLHVLCAKDGLEHLRFDCFEGQPHYHYVRHGDQRNQIVRFDEIANGSPLIWTIACIRNRLPEMLDYAGATSLAAAVRAEPQPVKEGADKVATLIGRVAETRLEH